MCDRGRGSKLVQNSVTYFYGRPPLTDNTIVKGFFTAGTTVKKEMAHIIKVILK